MAMTYQNFASLGVNLNRQKYGPLDISNVFTSENDLKYYLTKGTFTTGVSEYWYKNANEKIVPYPYEGQVLATVIDGVVNVYTLALDAEGNFITQEIAGKIEVDGTTIVKDAEGKLSIVAPEAPDASKIYNFSYENGVYSWKEVDTATAAGQAQAIASLTDRVDTNTINIAALDSKIGAASKPETSEGAGDGVAASGVYAAIEAALADAKAYTDSQDEATAYDDTALAGRVTTLETASGDYETRIAEVEKFFKVTGEDKINEALDTLVELQKEIAADDASAAAMLASINANTDAIALLNKTDGTVGSVKKTVDDAIAAENLSQYATSSALTTLSETVSGIENDLLTYAKEADVNAELAKKLESATISHTTESVGEGATVSGHNLNIVIDAFTKAETRDYVAGVIEDMTGGESAADVLVALNNYKDTNNERVGAIETKIGDAKTAEKAASGLYALIESAQTQADKAVTDAAAISADLTTAKSTIADNTREIGVAKDSINTVNTTLTSKITELEGKDTEFTTSITALQTAVSGHTTTITEYGTKISALESEEARLATLIQANTDKFAGYYTTKQVDDKVQEAIDAIPEAVDLSPYAKTVDVDADILAINQEMATKAIADDVYTKIAADAKFLTQDQVDARLNALITAADPDNDIVIKNIQNLVEYVDTNAGDIAQLLTDVATNKTAHEANAITINKNTQDIAAITSTVNSMVQPKESSEISVAADGVLGVKELNVNKLVQTAGDTLILNGGTSAV